MKFSKKLTFLSLFVGLFVYLSSCVEEVGDELSPQTQVALMSSGSANCSLFSYPDSIFFKSNTTPYIETVTTSLNGKFGAFPLGLSINTNNGSINVNTSEAGIRYKVFFVPTNSTDTCFKYLTISGVDFTSGVYNLATADSVVAPNYLGLTSILPCSDDDDDDEEEEEDDDDDDACEFDDDEDDDDGDGTADEPASGQDVTSQGVAINKANGLINLKQSMVNGALGVNPANGTSQTFRVYYRLNDNSQKALNFIDVRLHYYKKLSDVPQSLILQTQLKNQVYGGVLSNVSSKALRVMEAYGKRPPDIVIIGRFADLE